jgi:hypothetical protein
MQEPKLSGKIRRVVNRQKVLKFSENLPFYTRYAAFVSKALRKPRFQKFLKWIIRKEKIERNRVKDVQVRIFPLQKENGNGLAGRYKSRGAILIYPKSFEFYQELKREYGKEKALSYVEKRAQAALIHEFLHVKYSSDEEKVRKLTKKYFNIFTKNSENAYDISKLLFKE